MTACSRYENGDSHRGAGISEEEDPSQVLSGDLALIDAGLQGVLEPHFAYALPHREQTASNREEGEGELVFGGRAELHANRRAQWRRGQGSFFTDQTALLQTAIEISLHYSSAR